MGSEKYLEFMQVQNPNRKTKVFYIFNKNKVTGDFLGEIRWDCGWRQYVSEIETSSHEKMRFTWGCHQEASDFIKQLMDERKNV